MLHRAIVPHQQVAPPPTVPVDELRLHDVIGKGADQRLGLFRGDPLDAGAVVTHGVEALAPGLRMGAHDRVPHWRVALYFFPGRRKRALSPREIKDGAAGIDAAGPTLRARLPPPPRPRGLAGGPRA